MSVTDDGGAVAAGVVVFAVEVAATVGGAVGNATRVV